MQVKATFTAIYKYKVKFNTLAFFTRPRIKLIWTAVKTIVLNDDETLTTFIVDLEKNYIHANVM